MFGRFAVALVSVLLSLELPLALAGQGRERQRSSFSSDNEPYDGRFVFTRIRYGSFWGGRGWGGSWAHDYPRADRHLPRIIHELTEVQANFAGSDVYDLDDPAIFMRPLIYISEPGFWTMSDAEVQNLRDYLLKGGFVIFDDFEGEQWYNFERQFKRAMPEYSLIQIDITHPIFHSFFEMKRIYFPHPLVNVTPVYYGVFEHNDPTQRMIGIVNHNNDIAEYWEWSDTGLFPIDFTNEAYKLGVNYVIYAMTH